MIGSSFAATRRGLFALLATAAGATGAAVAVDAAWRADLRRPRLVLLGAGDHLSCLITAGNARLLLATGEDPVAFGNAWNQVRPLTAPRLDILLVAGAGHSLAVPAWVAAETATRFAASLGPSAASNGAAAFAGFAPPLVEQSRRFLLAPALSVTAEVAATEPAAEEPAPAPWRLTARFGETRVVILSHGEAAARFPPMERAACLVVAGRKPLLAWGSRPPPLVVSSGRLLDGDDMRAAAQTLAAPPRWGALVHPGETLTLSFAAGSLLLPPASAQELASDGA